MDANPLLMKSSIDHLPPSKQRELKRAVEVLLKDFEDALKGGSADFKKRGRILKVILFGSYARGGWVDEPHTRKGYSAGCGQQSQADRFRRLLAGGGGQIDARGGDAGVTSSL